jgi:hypothetical protein
MSYRNIGSNTEIKDTKEYFTIRISKEAKPFESQTKKSLNLATTHGFKRINDEYSVNLTISKKNPNYKE